MIQRWQDRTPTYGCLLRFGSISVIILLILGLGALWLMATGSMLPSSWASVFTIVFVMLGVLFTFFQWVFPLSKSQNSSSSPEQQPKMVQQNSSYPPLSFKVPGTSPRRVISSIFIHKAHSTNSAKNYTIIDSPNTNDKPSVHLLATPIWDNDRVYNYHPIGIGYREDIKKWAIFNQVQDANHVAEAPILPGAAFHVLVIEEDWM